MAEDGSTIFQKKSQRTLFNSKKQLKEEDTVLTVDECFRWINKLANSCTYF